MSDLTAINQVQAVEDWIKTQPQAEYECRHHFAGGVYEREILVPAGHVITGKIHLTEHLAKLVKGQMIIFSENERGTFEGPITFVSTPGVKRAGYAITDVTFSTFHAVGAQTDIDEIERELVVDSIQQYQIEVQKRLEGTA